jgi:hypothetical protein
MPDADRLVRHARLAGLIYLAIIGLGLFGEVAVRGALVVAGDAAGTMAKLRANESLWRAGVAGDLLMHALDLPLMLFFYLLLRPVDRTLALLTLLLNLVQTAVLALNKLTLIVPLLLLAQPQHDELAMLSIRLHGPGFAIGLVFFGLASLLRGVLIWRAGFLPRALGALLAVAGLCYLLNSFALLLAPPLAKALFPAVLVPAFVGELALALWLLVRGIDAAAWRRARTVRPAEPRESAPASDHLTQAR